ncbi:MAG: hypothetical protein KDK03_18435 [Rhodobacteraceae bacterium]|nr:hypothetical protein [Paracoccaceae bacterium]
MFRKPALAALLLAAATPALAGEASVSHPAAAASLHDGRLDMVAYYTEADAGAYEVVATFADRTGGQPMRVVMALADGDAVRFSMPGHKDALYGFARDGETLKISVETDEITSADLAQPRQTDL